MKREEARKEKEGKKKTKKKEMKTGEQSERERRGVKVRVSWEGGVGKFVDGDTKKEKRTKP